MHANPSLHNEKKETTAIIFCEIMMDAQLHGCVSAKKRMEKNCGVSLPFDEICHLFQICFDYFFETQQRTSNIRTKESTCQSDPTEPSLPN